MYNSTEIKSLFTINTTWQMTSEKLLKNSSSFTSKTAFIHQNAETSENRGIRNVTLD